MRVPTVGRTALYGDRHGSPGRDDRQNFGPPPATPDRRVAGTPPQADRQPNGPQADWQSGPQSGPQAGPQSGAWAADAPQDGARPVEPYDDFGTAVAEPLGRPRPAPRKPARRPATLKIAAVTALAVVVAGGGTAAFALTGDSSDGAAEVTASPRPPAADPAALQQQADAAEQARRKAAMNRADKAARVASVRKNPTLQTKGTPPPEPTESGDPSGGGAPPTAGNPVPAGEAQKIAKAMLPDFGFDPDTQFGCLVKLWDKESGWNYKAANPSSGAYGIPQALPGSKMASAGADWKTNPKTQIKWGLGYIKGRYKTPCGGWQHFLSKGWY